MPIVAALVWNTARSLAITVAAERAEFRTSVVDRIAIHGAQHPVGQIARPGGLQKMAAGNDILHWIVFSEGRVKTTPGAECNNAGE